MLQVGGLVGAKSLNYVGLWSALVRNFAEER